DGVTYIRIVSLEQEAAEREAERFHDLWAANNPDFLPPPRRSIPVKVWAFLTQGPARPQEIAEELRCTKGAVAAGVFYLRLSGQNVATLLDRDGRQCTYELRPGPPLRLLETPRGLKLAPRSGRVRANETVIELK
ncbi:MAG: hypothetical protein KAI66_23310, partial [Lentisphaeria bacterium]|nr:hypothetical protein [Lentisphaeria bacterium]